MNESITSRVGRIISGSMNALVDAVEDAAPEVILEQAVKEVDSAIDLVRVELGQVSANKHLASSRLMEESSRHEELTSQIQTALTENREDLAEAGVARQLDIEAQIPVLEKAISDAGDKEKELEGYIQALTARKREMKDELQRLTEIEQETAIKGHETAVNSSSKIASKIAKAESAFERVLGKHTGLASSNRPDTQHAAKLAELEELNRQNRIKERLAAVKANSDGEP